MSFLSFWSLWTHSAFFLFTKERHMNWGILCGLVFFFLISSWLLNDLENIFCSSPKSTTGSLRIFPISTTRAMQTARSVGKTQSGTTWVCTRSSPVYLRGTPPLLQEYIRLRCNINSNALIQNFKNIGAYSTLVDENESNDTTKISMSPPPISTQSPPANFRKRSSTMPTNMNHHRSKSSRITNRDKVRDFL